MKKIVLNYLMFVALVVVAAVTSCGGGGNGSGGGGKGKGLSGTYVGYRGTKVSYTFSGNKIKGVAEGQNEMIEGIFELVEDYKEDNFSRGTLIITDRNGKNEMPYQLEGNLLSFGGQSFIKNGKSGKIPDGNYYYGNNDDVYLSFSGNNLKMVDRGRINEYTYEFVVGSEEKGIIKGYLLMKYENEAGTMHCVLEKDKITINGEQTLTKK